MVESWEKSIRCVKTSEGLVDTERLVFWPWDIEICKQIKWEEYSQDYSTQIETVNTKMQDFSDWNEFWKPKLYRHKHHKNVKARRWNKYWVNKKIMIEKTTTSPATGNKIGKIVIKYPNGQHPWTKRVNLCRSETSVMKSVFP